MSTRFYNYYLSYKDERFSEKLLLASYDVFSKIAIPPSSLFFHKSEINDVFFNSPIEFVFKKLVREVVVDIESWQKKALDYCYCEVWSNKNLLAEERVAYHVDNDELIRKRTGKILVPLFGAILYVGIPPVVGGGTYFNPPLNDPTDDKNLFLMPHYKDIVHDAGQLVNFCSGRLVVFNGACPHCVQPFRTDLVNPRVALLCNIWGNCFSPI